MRFTKSKITDSLARHTRRAVYLELCVAFLASTGSHSVCVSVRPSVCDILEFFTLSKRKILRLVALDSKSTDQCSKSKTNSKGMLARHTLLSCSSRDQLIFELEPIRTRVLYLLLTIQFELYYGLDEV